MNPEEIDKITADGSGPLSKGKCNLLKKQVSDLKQLQDSNFEVKGQGSANCEALTLNVDGKELIRQTSQNEKKYFEINTDSKWNARIPSGINGSLNIDDISCIDKSGVESAICSSRWREMLGGPFASKSQKRDSNQNLDVCAAISDSNKYFGSPLCSVQKSWNALNQFSAISNMECEHNRKNIPVASPPVHRSGQSGSAR